MIIKKFPEIRTERLILRKIEAFTHFENENSKKLLEKNGFQIIKNRKDNDNLSNVIFEIRKANNSTEK